MKKNRINHEKSNKTWIIFIALVIIFSTHVYAQIDTIQTNVPALKNVYKNDFYIGCLLSYRHVGFPDDPPVPGQSAVIAPNGGHLIKFHMNSMSPGNNMKPQYTVDISASAAAYNAASAADKDSVDTHPVVRFNGDMIAQLNWAKRQGFTFRGHTLVWHSQTPGTAFFRSGYSSTGQRLTKEKMTARMDNYIKEVIRLIHKDWPGLLTAMDVVNEAVNESGADRTTESEWYVTFGDNSYLMKAFEFTRKWTVHYGETQIKLYYNDYNTHNPSKADGIVRICTPIFHAGYLDGIGMQDHDALTTPTAAQWIASYNKFYPICTEMAVTELDVNPGSGTPTPAILTTQANQYAMLFKCFVERSYRSGRGKIVSVSKDGLNDQYAFVANASLWDNRNQCKPAFYAVVNVGINYNALDSLIAHGNTLQEREYTAESWANFAAALASAKSAMAQNYSASVSAAEALHNAKVSLKSALDGLVKITTAVNEVNGNTPKVFALSQNYPNPFNPTTQINYSVPQDAYLSLKVYNLLGDEVATLFEGVQPAGNYTATFDGRDLASGVYLYQLKANNFMETKRLVLVK
ncbi:MAG: endo-1,4-beta-xylanase [candidate division KSB1 bacterium]|nr:endo-1,4-beta-xylanase [candidate division KSB1 bacterium]MDZ7302541.1 endo-1,4-beta-xylanase [candidate division KSB1 bacterium]MDZ7310693.1 endo-1,4-beta-xylanase [candidate division KSB1 bacterium]